MSRKYSRRSALQMVAGMSTSALVGACSSLQLASSTTDSRRSRRLTPVLASPDRVIRHVVGLRPFRRSGFNVSVEPGQQVIVHNYGHGGGGVSLSWGTAHLALQHALMTSHRDAGVLGCGAVGLATARLLQDHGFSVTVYARDLPPNTTSNIAGASWLPFEVFDADRRTPAFDDQFVRAARFAFGYFQNLVSTRYGISWREEYELFEAGTVELPTPSPEQVLLGNIGTSTVNIPVGEHPFGTLRALRTLRMLIEPAIYLQAVLTDFRLAGGRVVVRELTERRLISELPHALIVNCTGLGAGALFDDRDVIPIKGQLTVLAPQPEVDYLTVGPGNLYMMPRQDGIILGGTFEHDVWSLEPDPREAQRILEGHQKLFARMR